ncbi:MAG: response regulator transcription factor [Verrucomicrobiota bacterium]
MIRVFVVEDNDAVRKSWRLILDGTRGFACAGDCASGEQALEQVPKAAPHVVLLDIRLKKMSGILCAQRLKELMPGLQILMLTKFAEDDLIFQSLKAGASGYILQSESPARILEAAELVHNGGSIFTPSIARRIALAFQAPAQRNRDLDALSDRERELLQAMVDHGVSTSKDLARILSISERTVDAHIRNILQKLHAATRTDAVLKFVKG